MNTQVQQPSILCIILSELLEELHPEHILDVTNCDENGCGIRTNHAYETYIPGMHIPGYPIIGRDPTKLKMVADALGATL